MARWFLSIRILAMLCFCIWIHQTVALPFNLEPETSSLVVIGAHHFGHDANDPLYENIKDIQWNSTLLVEASPPIAKQLTKLVGQNNPTPNVPPNRVYVVSEGIIPGNRTTKPKMLNFYNFDADEIPGLPFWATQIGSFSRWHVLKLLPRLADSRSAARYPYRYLRKHVKVMQVKVKPLATMLSEQRVEKVGLMILDTEGLDCAIVASIEWASYETCRWRPDILIFERSHCLRHEYDAARAALLHAQPCPPQNRNGYRTSYVAVNEAHDNGNNAAFALKPVSVERERWLTARWLSWLNGAPAAHT